VSRNLAVTAGPTITVLCGRDTERVDRRAAGCAEHEIARGIEQFARIARFDGGDRRHAVAGSKIKAAGAAFSEFSFIELPVSQTAPPLARLMVAAVMPAWAGFAVPPAGCTSARNIPNGEDKWRPRMRLTLIKMNEY